MTNAALANENGAVIVVRMIAVRAQALIEATLTRM